MIILLVVCVILTLLLMVSWISILNSKRRYNVDGPSVLPVLGNAHLFVVKSTEILNLLYKISKKYGDAYIVYFLSSPFLVLSHPQYIEPIVSSSELITKGDSYRFLQPWLGQGLLTATGQRWKAHRKFLTPAFHFNILQNFLPVFNKNAKILTEQLDHRVGETISLFPVIALAALDNVTEAIMGVSVESQKNSNSKYVKSIEVLTQIIAQRMQVPILGEGFIFNLTPYKRQQDEAIHFLHEHTRNVIRARKDDLKRLNIHSLKESNDLGIKNKHAFLDLLLMAEVDGNKIDEESIREEVDTFMFEGHDTTTSGIVFTLFCLSKYQDVQEKVLQEQISILGLGDLDRDPTYTELQQMKYLEMVIKETLRIYPSVPLIERKVIRDIEVGGLKLLKGTSVAMNIYQMQRHPAVFEDPLAFRPERFEAGSPETKNPFAYLAFSAGPRNCIGQRFAMMELKVTVAQVVKKFKILPIKQEPKLCADLILRSKNGIHVQLARRFYLYNK